MRHPARDSGGGPSPAAVPPREAATVVLLRDGPDGLQTWLLTRRTTLAFAAGMSVYPGGRVDPADAAVRLARPGAATEVAQRFGIDGARAHALLVAAARELFEETGVLFTDPVVVARGDEWDDIRTRVESREREFGQVLVDHGCRVDADAFVPWARWVTPEAEPRRYDTFFFLAVLPEGGQARDVTTESTVATWVDVNLAVAQQSEFGLMPPTLATMQRLATFERAGDVVAEARAFASDAIAPIMPVLQRIDSELVAVLPDGQRLPVQRSALFRPT